MAVCKTVANFSSIIFILGLITHSTIARIHKLKLENDDRKQIDLSTFGFLKNGYMAVKITDFSVGSHDMSSLPKNTYGFTLDKTVSTGISPYLEGEQGSCILEERRKANKKEDSVSVLFLRMDFTQEKLLIERRGDDLKNLRVLDQGSKELKSPQRKRRSFSFLRDSYLMHDRVRRELPKDPENEATRKKAEKSGNKVGAAPNNTPKNPDGVRTDQEPPTGIQTKTNSTSVNTTQSKELKTPENVPAVDVDKRNKTVQVTARQGNSTDVEKVKLVTEIPLVKDGNGRFSTSFKIWIENEAEQGLYNLFFYNCGNYGNVGNPSLVNFTAHITETNKDNYLSAGQMPLPTLYFCLCVLYFFAGCYWFYILRSSEKETVFKIHYLMLTLVFVKSVALLFHAVNFYFIQKEGHHEEAFAILYYITHLMKGALLFITIVLIGAGWAFVKHILSDRDKKIFIIVIPLQVLANVAQIIIEETEEGQSQYTTWKEVFILVDLLCCGAILFPVVWSIRHLQEASTTDGKAAINLAKLKIFRHFYIMIVCYIYFTRIIVYLLKITVPFQYEWLDELFRELATFIFFTVTGYKFRPASNNPYLQVSTDSDDEIEMDEVLTKSGALDDVVRVNLRTKPTDGSTPTKRESSHEYD